MNYYPFHIGDYRSGCIHLSQLERWVYRDLLDVCYDTEGPLPLDHAVICRMIGARTEEHRAAVLTVLEDKFEKTPDGYVNARVQSEIDKYQKKADSARTANQKRWGSDRLLKSDADQIATKNQEPRTKNHTPPKAPQGAGLFEEFWAAFPRKVGKDAAQKAFEKRKPDRALVDEMLAAIATQKASPQWAKDGGDFIPHPSTWLNQGRWQDEPGEKSLWPSGYVPMGSPAGG